MINLWTLFAAYFKIGLFTIGGGYAMIPLIQQEIVDTHAWISMQQFTNFIAIAESTPGPFAVNTATFVGMKIAGIPGAVAAVLGCILPSFIIILIIAKWMQSFSENKFVKSALYGMMPVVIALILNAVIILFMHNVLNTGFDHFSLAQIDYKAVVCCGLSALCYYRFKMNPILLIILCAGFGLLFYGVLPLMGVWA